MSLDWMDSPIATDLVAAKLARAFLAELREVLTVAEWAEMAARNRAETSPGVCHSHDFCDANEIMIRAYQRVGLLAEPDPRSDSDCRIWSRAWDLASKELR